MPEFTKATVADREAVFALYRSVVGTPFCVWSDKYPLYGEIDRDLAAESLYVLKENGVLIGALSVEPQNELLGLPFFACKGKSEEIARVVVSPACRGRGLAAYMVTEVEKILKREGCAAIWLAAAKVNIPAQKTYLRCGFQRVGEAEIFGGDYDLMEKML